MLKSFLVRMVLGADIKRGGGKDTVQRTGWIFHST